MTAGRKQARRRPLRPLPPSAPPAPASAANPADADVSGPIRAGLTQALAAAAEAGLIRARHGVLVAVAGRYADLADEAEGLEDFEAAEGRLRTVLSELEASPGGDDDEHDDEGTADDERAGLLAIIHGGPTLGDAANA